jgi:XTP/dITP diphosphohydrolase
MKRLLIATHNPAKLQELRELLSDLPLELVSLSDVNIHKEVDENGTTYEENSQTKALLYAKEAGLPAVSDDGGIEIVALNGEPGVYSKVWLGKNTTEDQLIAHMQQVANDLPDDNRTAYFKVVLSLALPSGKVWSVTGEIEGIVAKKPFIQQRKGYPYRSFFFLPKLNKYYFESELTPEEQRQYNHRVIAVEKLKPLLKRELRLV